MEVLWKTVVGLLNLQFTLAIQSHDVLHEFQAGCGMGTFTLEFKLLQHITAMRGTFLYKIFMDLQKVYGALDWDRCLEILVAYGVGLRVICILRMCWGQLTMVARARG